MTAEMQGRQEEAQYTVWFQPAFDDCGTIAVAFGRAGDFVRIASGAHEETVPIPLELSQRFLHEMKALEPLEIPEQPPKLMIDGITLWCRAREEGGSRTFQTKAPRPEEDPRQYGFIQTLYRLAWDVARAPASVQFLEQFFGYLDGRLPVQMFDESPRRIRLFDRLYGSQLDELRALLDSIPPEEPVLMDLSDMKTRGSIPCPLFAGFQRRPGRTAWLVNEYISRELSEAGLPPASLYLQWEKALEALQDSRDVPGAR